MKRSSNLPFWAFMLCLMLAVVFMFVAATPATVQAAPAATFCGPGQHSEETNCRQVWSWFLWRFVTVCDHECVADDPPPVVCEDPEANNYGDEGECTYDPPPAVCEDEAANNYGEEGECTYDDPPVVATPDLYGGGKSCYMLGWGPKGCSHAAGADRIAILRSQGVPIFLYHRQ